MTISTNSIRDLLRKRYAGEEWFLAFEVRNAPGFATREGYADAIAMGVWPSRGFVIHGFEIKVSRSDWLRELAKPEKADRFLKHCDHWWLVAPKGVAHDSEVPASWGIMQASEKRLRIVRDTPPVVGRTTRKDMDRGFVASLVKRRSAEDDGFKEAVRGAVADAEKRARESEALATKNLRREFEKLHRWQTDFETALGMKHQALYERPEYTAERIKAALKFLRGADEYALIGMERSAKHVAKLISDLRETIGATKDKGVAEGEEQA